MSITQCPRGETRAVSPGVSGRCGSAGAADGAGEGPLGTQTTVDPSSADALVAQVAADGRAALEAAGGIHTAAEVREMITAGATRIGASAGVRIVCGEEGESGAAAY